MVRHPTLGNENLTTQGMHRPNDPRAIKMIACR